MNSLQTVHTSLMLGIIIQKVLLILTCSDLQSTAASAVFPQVYLDSIGICQTS